MIRLEFGLNDNVIMTLSEYVTLPNPVYLLELTNQQSLDVSYLVISDNSLQKQRYNRLQIFVTNDEPNAPTLEGNVYLTNTGFYDYKVYECVFNPNYTQASDYINVKGDQLESGLVWLVPSATSNTPYQPDNTDTIIYQNV
jgi:hypothetical protein